jgi:ornithine--oxo-acid transaminase
MLTIVQAKPTHQNIIRLTPPLVITDEEIRKALSIIKESLEQLPGLKGRKAAEIIPSTEKGVRIAVEN